MLDTRGFIPLKRRRSITPPWVNSTRDCLGRGNPPLLQKHNRVEKAASLGCLQSAKYCTSDGEGCRYGRKCCQRGVREEGRSCEGSCKDVGGCDSGGEADAGSNEEQRERRDSEEGDGKNGGEEDPEEGGDDEELEEIPSQGDLPSDERRRCPFCDNSGRQDEQPEVSQCDETILCRICFQLEESFTHARHKLLEESTFEHVPYTIKSFFDSIFRTYHITADEDFGIWIYSGPGWWLFRSVENGTFYASEDDLSLAWIIGDNDQLWDWVEGGCRILRGHPYVPNPSLDASQMLFYFSDLTGDDSDAVSNGSES